MIFKQGDILIFTELITGWKYGTVLNWIQGECAYFIPLVFFADDGKVSGNIMDTKSRKMRLSEFQDAIEIREAK